MTVKDLVEKCYDKIILYTNTDDEYYEFIDLYKGPKEKIPEKYLNKKSTYFWSEKKRSYRYMYKIR